MRFKVCDYKKFDTTTIMGFAYNGGNKNEGGVIPDLKSIIDSAYKSYNRSNNSLKPPSIDTLIRSDRYKATKDFEPTRVKVGTVIEGGEIKRVARPISSDVGLDSLTDDEGIIDESRLSNYHEINNSFMTMEQVLEDQEGREAFETYIRPLLDAFAKSDENRAYNLDPKTMQLHGEMTEYMSELIMFGQEQETELSTEKNYNSYLQLAKCLLVFYKRSEVLESYLPINMLYGIKRDNTGYGFKYEINQEIQNNAVSWLQFLNGKIAKEKTDNTLRRDPNTAGVVNYLCGKGFSTTKASTKAMYSEEARAAKIVFAEMIRLFGKLDLDITKYLGRSDTDLAESILTTKYFEDLYKVVGNKFDLVIDNAKRRLCIEVDRSKPDIIVKSDEIKGVNLGSQFVRTFFEGYEEDRIKEIEGLKMVSLELSKIIENEFCTYLEILDKYSETDEIPEVDPVTNARCILALRFFSAQNAVVKNYNDIIVIDENSMYEKNHLLMANSKFFMGAPDKSNYAKELEFIPYYLNLTDISTIIDPNGTYYYFFGSDGTIYEVYRDDYYNITKVSIENTVHAMKVLISVTENVLGPIEGNMVRLNELDNFKEIHRIIRRTVQSKLNWKQLYRRKE